MYIYFLNSGSKSQYGCVCTYVCIQNGGIGMQSAFTATDCVNKKFENVALHNTRKAFHVILPHKRRTQSFATKARQESFKDLLIDSVQYIRKQRG